MTGRSFIACAKALENWDLVALREAWRLPREMPLDALADLVARVGHLERQDAEHIDSAVLRSSAHPWLKAAGQLRSIRDQLPAVCAFLAAQDSKSR